MSFKQGKSKRTLAGTINELIDSPRMAIAVDNFSSDKMLMKALLTEMCLEVFNVSKNTVIKRYNTYSSLPQFEMLPLLREINPDDLITFNIYFNLSPLEVQLYLAEKNGMPKEERTKLLEKLRKQMMEAS